MSNADKTNWQFTKESFLQYAFAKTELTGQQAQEYWKFVEERLLQECQSQLQSVFEDIRDGIRKKRHFDEDEDHAVGGLITMKETDEVIEELRQKYLGSKEESK